MSTSSNFEARVTSSTEESIKVKERLLSSAELVSTVAKIVEMLVNALEQGKKVLLFGNGGSAADAQHLAAEFSGRFYKNRNALPAEALHCNTSYLTAVANDYSYDMVYARLMDGIGNKGDVLVGLSTSGNSGNIMKAFEVANEKGITTIGLTGYTGGTMKAVSDLLINVPSTDTPRIQESHILIGHIICQLVEERIFQA